MKNPLLSLLVVLTLGYVVALAEAQFAFSAVQGWYLVAVKPAWSIPPWLIVPLASVIYGLSGVAAWQVLMDTKSSSRRAALAFYGSHLAIRLAWSLIFFAEARFLPGLILSCLDAIVIVVTTILFFKVRRTAGWLLSAVSLWALYYLALSLFLWRMSP
jgi:tryptophan-rich sensory protein